MLRKVNSTPAWFEGMIMNGGFVPLQGQTASQGGLCDVGSQSVLKSQAAKKLLLQLSSPKKRIKNLPEFLSSSADGPWLMPELLLPRGHVTAGNLRDASSFDCVSFFVCG